MMYSYPTRKMENGYVSVNFVFSFDQAKEMCAFSDEKQWYQLEAADGSSLSVGCNEAGKAYVLTDKERAERVSSGLYDVFEEQIDVQDITIRLYREKLFFNMENELYQVQLINMVLIAAGTILSAITSWVLSKRHMNEITRLEGIAQGDGGYRFSQTNAYNRLQNIIVTGLNESKERALQLRTQTAYMIFQGWFDGLENINKAFQELGYKGCPERFFVGIVSTATRLTEEQIPTGLKKCLRVHIIHEYHEAVAFLYELEVGDGNQIQRKKIADYIRNELHKCGIKKVCIGMSQVYTNPLMINYAYTQANSVLEKILAGKTEDYCGCWESEVQNVHFYLPEKTLLDDFAEALAKRNFQEAKKQFNNIIHGYSSKECSDENRAYVRYEILGCMVKHFCAESTIENTILLNECLNINVKDEKKFVRTVENLLKQCLVEKDGDNFIRMLDYVEKNYYRSDLTHEEVAVIGGISKTYVGKIFRMKLGMSYIEYLTSVRMDKAAILLRTTDYSVNDIVKMVGYEDASSFRRCFREKYGINATDYRKRERQIKEER